MLKPRTGATNLGGDIAMTWGSGRGFLMEALSAAQERRCDDEELDEILSRCEAASAGPWVSVVEGRDQPLGGASFIMTGHPGARGEDLYLHPPRVADQDFVAHCRQDVPILIAEIRRLRRLLEEARG